MGPPDERERRIRVQSDVTLWPSDILRRPTRAQLAIFLSCTVLQSRSWTVYVRVQSTFGGQSRRATSYLPEVNPGDQFGSPERMSPSGIPNDTELERAVQDVLRDADLTTTTKRAIRTKHINIHNTHHITFVLHGHFSAAILLIQ